MEILVINEVVETRMQNGHVYEIKVLPFAKDEIGLYEDGVRKALKAKTEKAGMELVLDFSDENFMNGLDDRALFDVLQFIAFNCLRYKKLRIKWSAAMLEYLLDHGSRKNRMWKMSSLTVNKLISAGCEPEYTKKN